MVATDLIIKQLCKETGDPGFHNYTDMLGNVIDGIRDLSIYNMPSYAHAVLDISNFNAVEWPTGVVKPILTCLLRDGNCVILDVDDQLRSTYPQRSQESETITSDNQIKDAFGIDGNYFRWSNGFNWGLGELYGLTGFYAVGYVTHNKNTRQTTIKGNCLLSSDQIVMFYITDGLDDCPKFVPSECKTAIEHYALYKYYRTRNPGLGQQNLKDYKENFTRLNKFYTADDDYTWIAAMNSSTKSSPKG